jgi:hypothetical protein
MPASSYLWDGTADAAVRIMRALLLVCLIASTASAGNDRSLSAELVQHYASPYLPAIKACYLKHGRMKGATGDLRITMVVNRAGAIHELAIQAPGVTGLHLRRLTACIRTEVDSWQFPPRPDFTTAVLPFYFLALDLSTAGPQYSCWNPQGCPARAHDRLQDRRVN